MKLYFTKRNGTLDVLIEQLMETAAGIRRPEYVREMKRYGVLPAAFDLARDPIDPYALDRTYWDLFVWKPGAPLAGPLP